jgi:CheY-like chemotaxis protein/anti-sigma regulatory factor (Ser/Thr protein kinase)
MTPWFKPWQAQQQAYDAQRKRNLALQAEFQALQQASAQGQQLMGRVSHALRTPMNAILGFMHLLQARVDDAPEARRLLRAMRQSADHLQTVIDDVLDDASLEAGVIAINQETFALRDVITIVFDLFHQRAQDAEVIYICEIDEGVPHWVCTDRHRVTQILVNLLGNAFKFTAQGQITLRVQIDPEGLRFSVEDTGVGIAASEQARIFERYEQADTNTATRYGGHGLGLSISSRLVTLMGGRMGVQSEPGKGALFWFTLPLTPEASPEETTATLDDTTSAAENALEQAPRFLVVDDHPVHRLLLTQLLKTNWKHAEVMEAETGAQALERLTQQTVDLVLMDMVMPEMDGIAATQGLRQHPNTENTCVLGLTANIHAQDQVRFRAAGVNAIALKPFDATALCTQIAQLLKEKKSSQGS